jgi:hypothetical protein
MATGITSQLNPEQPDFVPATRFSKLEATLDHLKHFRSGKPTPTHRFTGLAA